MAALTTLNITEKNANNSLSVTVKRHKRGRRAGSRGLRRIHQ